MKILILFIIAFLISVTGLGDTLTVSQSGTGNYSLIQDAVDNSSSGDIIVVWPGIYHENVFIEDKNITIGSLYLTTGELNYRDSTIVDGDSIRSCFEIRNCGDLIVVNGFTITNGSGTSNGGAIYVRNCKVEITNCLIYNNVARHYGGGIFIWESEAFLSNNVIYENFALERSGGVESTSSEVVFDSINRNSVYCNYAPLGTDIVRLNDTTQYTFCFDTFTVSNPNCYYAYSMVSDGVYHNISYDINSGKIDQVFNDLYVSVDGDNNNTGLTSGEPLRDIYYALLKIGTDSTTHRSIHIASGEYSYNTGEKFPLGLKYNMSLIGEDKNNTILNANDIIFHIHNLYNVSNIKLSELTFFNGNGNINSNQWFGSVRLSYNDDIVLEDLIFRNNYARIASALSFDNCKNTLANSIKVFDNMGGKGITINQSNLEHEDSNMIQFTNSMIFNNYPDITITDHSPGGGMSIQGGYNAKALIINCLIDNNMVQKINNGAASGGIGSHYYANVYIVNSTIVDNISDNPKAAALGISYGSTVNIYNSIIYNNDYAPAYMMTDIYSGDCYLNVFNSLFDGGQGAIQQYSANNYIYYDNTNIDTDPLFYGGAEFPYNLSNVSPCIDAGTQDIPAWIDIPDTDLAGNPRIYGETIDIGAYEWNPTVGLQENLEGDGIKLDAAPNPLSDKTVINLTVTEPATLSLVVYSNYGQIVKTLLRKQYFTTTATIPWYGDDDNGIKLSNGNYFLVLEKDGREVEVLKLIIVR